MGTFLVNLGTRNKDIRTYRAPNVLQSIFLWINVVFSLFASKKYRPMQYFSTICLHFSFNLKNGGDNGRRNIPVLSCT